MIGTWGAVGATAGILVLYELWLLLAQRKGREGLAPAAHANLREEWFAAVSEQKGSEILAVQTLRNSLMSATLIATTAVLALMGSLTLTVSSLRESGDFTPRLLMELGVLMLLLMSLIASVMAVRYFNHAGYVVGLPVESEARKRWAAVGSLYTRKAGLLYSFALRQLVLVMPVVAAIVHPMAGLVTAVVAVGALISFDRFQS